MSSFSATYPKSAVDGITLLIIDKVAGLYPAVYIRSINASFIHGVREPGIEILSE